LRIDFGITTFLGQQHSSSERQVQRTNSALNMTTQTRGERIQRNPFNVIKS